MSDFDTSPESGRRRDPENEIEGPPPTEMYGTPGVQSTPIPPQPAAAGPADQDIYSTPPPPRPETPITPPPGTPPAEDNRRKWIMYGLGGGGLLLCALCACMLVMATAFNPDSNGGMVDDGGDNGNGGVVSTPRPSATPEPEEISVFDLEAGDCFNFVQEQTETGLVENIEIVSCGQPHENELYFTVDYPAGSGEPFPGEDAIDEFAGEQCLSAFADFVGIDFNESVLNVRYFQPIPDSWDDRDDREIACFLFEEGVTLDESMQGAER